MNRIIKYIILDILKNKILIVYTLLLALLTWSVFGLEDNTSKGLLTLLNVILISVPLVSIIFSTIYLYNSNEFIELLVSQPIKRNKIYKSLFNKFRVKVKPKVICYLFVILFFVVLFFYLLQ